MSIALKVPDTIYGASLDVHYAHIWFVECGLCQFYHDSDSETDQRTARLSQDDTANYPLCHKTSNLIPCLHTGTIQFIGRKTNCAAH